MENMILDGTQCGLVTYKINDDILAQVLAYNGITSVGFDNASGIRTVSTEDGMIFAKEDGEAELPQMLFLAWSGCGTDTLDAEDRKLYDDLKCILGSRGRADCMTYNLRSQMDGSAGSKLKVIAELFSDTDIADKLDITVTHSAYPEASVRFGFDRISYKNGSQVFRQLNFVGDSYTEDNAALLFKDGRLSITDRGTNEWENDTAEEFMLSLNDAAAIEGVTVLEKLNCKNIEKLVLLPVFLEIGDGALKGCTSLKEVDILKKNIMIGRDIVSDGVVIGGCKGSTAEHYAKTNGIEFVLLEEPERESMEFEIADDVCVTADNYSVLRRDEKGRLTLNDVGFTPYEGCSDDIDCEIVIMTEAEAADSGLAAQLVSFGELIDTGTVRNDRNGYIKATMMKNSEHRDIYGCVLEIDHSGMVICIHAEKQFTDEDIEKGADKALFERIKQLGESVRFGEKTASGAAAVPVAVPASAETPAVEVSAGETEPETTAFEVPVEEEPIVESEPETTVFDAPVEENASVDADSEVTTFETHADEIPADETNPEVTEFEIPAEEPVIEAEPETTEFNASEEVLTDETDPEANAFAASDEDVSAEETEHETTAFVMSAVEESVAEAEPEVNSFETPSEEVPTAEAEVIGEQNDPSDDEVIDVEPEDISSADENGAVRLVSGARYDLNEYASQMLVIDMDYQAEDGLDIDGYVFLLNDEGKVRSDADLVFFGQKASVDKAVNNHPQQTRMFTVELSKLDPEITKLAVAFAIYGDKEGQTFGKVSKPTVRIKCGGTELCNYEFSGLDDERSVVALEIYNKNGWKAKTIGLGFKLALKTLCGSYGVEVKD